MSVTTERRTNLRRTELLETVRAALPGSAMAVVACILAITTIVISLFRQPLDLVASLAGLAIAVPVAMAAIAAGPVRIVAAIAALALAAVAPSLLLLGGRPGSALLVALLYAGAAVGARRAVHAAVLRPPRARIAGGRVGASAHPVLLANPKSGGGTIERISLGAEAVRRGIEYLVLGPGDDLRLRAEEAVQRGADVVGMAGGDGSQAVVAQVAMTHDVAFVCVPVGTRNHFAKDLGLDPGDPVGALHAFGDAEEIRIDLGMIADRVFVNNASFGIYAVIAGTEGYREHKPETAWQVLPGVLGPEAGPVDIRFTGPDGREQAGFQLLLISNDPYRFTADSRFGSRDRLDLGVLGITAAKGGVGDDFLAFATEWWRGGGGRPSAWLQWQATEIEVRSAGPIPAGVDGEALMFDPPVQVRSLPSALRVRVAPAGVRSR